MDILKSNMNIEDKRKGCIECEICKEKPACKLKGGIYEDKSDMWLVCNDCTSKIKDRRLK